MKTIYCDTASLIYCVDAHRRGKSFIVKSDELLTAFLELEAQFSSG